MLPDFPRERTQLLVAFIDLTGYTAMARVISDLELAEFLDRHYARVTEVVEKAPGRVVKFIGDGALLVFEEQFAEAGVAALVALKEQTDAWLREVAPRSRLMVKAHFGPVIAGGFGPTRTFDVIGETVNTTARLAADGFALSPEAFAKLTNEALRHRFRKNTPPITYALHWTAGAEKPEPVTEHDEPAPE